MCSRVPSATESYTLHQPNSPYYLCKAGEGGDRQPRVATSASAPSRTVEALARRGYPPIGAASAQQLVVHMRDFNHRERARTAASRAGQRSLLLQRHSLVVCGRLWSPASGVRSHAVAMPLSLGEGRLCCSKLRHGGCYEPLSTHKRLLHATASLSFGSRIPVLAPAAARCLSTWT